MENKLLAKAKKGLLRRLSRPRTVHEALEYLAAFELDSQTESELIAEMTKAGFLNDERFSRLWLEDRHYHKGFGPIRLKQELQKKGINKELIEDMISEVFADRTAVLARMQQAVEQKFRDSTLYGEAKIRKKMWDTLFRLGYPSEMITTVISDITRWDFD